jgi:hypothetical protein
MKKNTITKEESKAAMNVQRPLDEGDHETKAIARISTFKQLAKVSRSARQMFGGNAQWKQAKMLFDSRYRDGLESPPFFITRAFKYQSKEIAGNRLGVEMCFSNGQFCTVGFGLNENDSKRMAILDSFPEGKGDPIGPFCIVGLPTDKGNDYYDIIPYVKENVPNSEMEIPFVEFDEDIPF